MRYLKPAETNRLIRKALKTKFPGVKFSVSGDNTCRIRWTDGPSDHDVSLAVSGFRTGGFDGSIDMAYYATSYLLPDGTVIPANCSGTTGSKGYVEPYSYSCPAGGEEVSFGIQFIFTNRTISPDFEAKCTRAFDMIGCNARHVFRMNAHSRQYDGESDGMFLARNIAA